jgi:hypothetical protein
MRSGAPFRPKFRSWGVMSTPARSLLMAWYALRCLLAAARTARRFTEASADARSRDARGESRRSSRARARPRERRPAKRLLEEDARVPRLLLHVPVRLREGVGGVAAQREPVACLLALMNDVATDAAGLEARAEVALVRGGPRRARSPLGDRETIARRSRGGPVLVCYMWAAGIDTVAQMPCSVSPLLRPPSRWRVARRGDRPRPASSLLVDGRRVAHLVARLATRLTWARHVAGENDWRSIVCCAPSGGVFRPCR